MKRVRSDDDTGAPTAAKTDSSEAAKFNLTVLRKLQRLFAADPETDLLANFPTSYSSRLAGRKKQDRNNKSDTDSNNLSVPAEKDDSADPHSVRDANSVMDGAPATVAAAVHLEQDSKSKTIAVGLGLPSVGTVTVVSPLSEPVQRLLDAQAQEPSGAFSTLWTRLYSLINASEIIWQNGARGGVAVMKCSENVVVKMVPNFEDFTEYTTMEYLEQHAPELPIPRPLGVLTLGGVAYIFMSFIPGPTLETVWSRLPNEQKASISHQLSRILLKLRELDIPKDSQLGGVGGEGCKDTRRHTRIRKAIRSIAEFEDFIFSDPHFGGSVYIKLLRSMSQSHMPKVVFSHGDFRPANIVVKSDQQGNYSVSGVLDWEMGGFYPDYWESVKATNTMSPQEEDDWYLHLPACASPTSYPLHWLVDRKWDVHVA